MSFWDDDAGYDIRDPKHPDYADRAFHAADHFRKADRENPEPKAEEESACTTT